MTAGSLPWAMASMTEKSDLSACQGCESVVIYRARLGKEQLDRVRANLEKDASPRPNVTLDRSSGMSIQKFGAEVTDSAGMRSRCCEARRSAIEGLSKSKVTPHRLTIAVDEDVCLRKLVLRAWYSPER